MVADAERGGEAINPSFWIQAQDLHFLQLWINDPVFGDRVAGVELDFDLPVPLRRCWRENLDDQVRCTPDHVLKNLQVALTDQNQVWLQASRQVQNNV